MKLSFRAKVLALGPSANHDEFIPYFVSLSNFQPCGHLSVQIYLLQETLCSNPCRLLLLDRFFQAPNGTTAFSIVSKETERIYPPFLELKSFHVKLSSAVPSGLSCWVNLLGNVRLTLLFRALIKGASPDNATAAENLDREYQSYCLPGVASAACFRKLYDVIRVRGSETCIALE